LPGLLVPLIIYFVEEKDSPIRPLHAAQALNFGLTQMIVVSAGRAIGSSLSPPTPRPCSPSSSRSTIYELVAPWSG